MPIDNPNIYRGRIFACLALDEFAYFKTLDSLLIIAAETKLERDPVSVPSRSPDEFKAELHYVIDKARRCIQAKKLVDDILPLEVAKASLILELPTIVDRIETSLLNQLEANDLGKMSPADRKDFYQKISGEATLICAVLIEHHKRICRALARAKGNLRSQLRDSKSQQRPADVSKVCCVCIDMERYSLMARFIQAGQDAHALFRFNQTLQKQIQKAIQQAGLDGKKVPVYPTGDGALIYCPDADSAVNVSIEVQRESFSKNLDINHKEWRQSLRIGIDLGKVVMDIVRTPRGEVLGFSAAGVPIINSVRIQSECTRRSIAISRDAWGSIKDDALRRKFGGFRKTPRNPKKPHEPQLEFCELKSKEFF